METKTRKQAIKDGCTIWEGNDEGVFYARQTVDRERNDYGKVFLIE